MKGKNLRILLATLLLACLPLLALAQDEDGDQMPDAYELAHPCLNPAIPDGDLDPDNDGMTSLQEYQYSSSLDPCNPDTDFDGSNDGIDCAKLNNAHWSDCGTCVDSDGDNYGADCDLGPDCDDANPNAWNTCATCMDADGDGWYAGCNDYGTILGPDCNDTNTNVWDACFICRDTDADGWYFGCNRYQTINGPDCSDTNPNVWNTCAACHDLDADTWYAGCNQYQTINGPDCDDANPFTWDTCATCNDNDGDGYYGLCNRYTSNPSPVTVGTGTGPLSYPLRTGSHDARTQVIYLASQIGQAGNITALALDVTAIPGQVMNSFTIRMKPTALNSYSPTSWEGPSSGWTTVYQANEPPGATGWHTFTLTTPFAYNGAGNLMVDFSFNNSSSSTNGASRSTSTGVTRSATFSTNSAFGDPLSWTGTANPAPTGSTYIPNLRFTFASSAILGPDCDDADPNAWDTCATCLDGDGDNWHQLCNQYVGINGPDCDDANPNTWNTCATCRDNDLDTWWTGCNRYLTVNGPDCNDTQAAINPGQAEVFCDGVDNDCNPATLDAPDQDGDGLTICQETAIGTSDLNPDTDGDGLTDGYEVNTSYTNPLLADTDGDGLTDGYEINISHTDPFEPDSDWDGLSDCDEVNLYGTDPLNRDTDGDGLEDHEEVDIYGTSPVNPDTDGDGLNDYREIFPCGRDYECHPAPCCLPTNPLVPDTDGDGLSDGYEVDISHTKPLLADTDGDGRSDGDEVNIYGTDPLKSDTDGDGLPDGWETAHSCMQAATADASQDYDTDGLTNLQEYQAGTDPCSSDPDGDGMPDDWEVQYVSCGLDPNVNDAGLDPDADTMTNLQEYLALTDPCVVNDADGDGMPDYYEVLHACLNPAVNDTLDDPDADLWTNLYEYQHGTDPCVMIDSDGDAMADWWEEVHSSCGLNPLAGDSMADADGDGLSNLAEYRLNSNPCLPDSDADGILDFDEVNIYHTDPTLADTDGDGLSDPDEIFIHSTDPLNPDSDADGVDDGTEIDHGGNPLDSRIVPAFGKFGPDVRLTSGVNYTLKSPTLRWTGSEYGIIWIGTRDGSRGIDITRFDPDGQTIGDDKLVVPIGSSYFGTYSAIWTGSEYALSWNDPRNGNDEIYFARLNPEGEMLGPEVRATFNPARSYEPVLAWSGSEFGIGWSDNRSPDLSPYFMRLDGQGNKISSDLLLSMEEPGSVDPGSLVWTGSEYGLSYLSMYWDPPGWPHGNFGQGLRFSRISPSGSQVDSTWISGAWPYGSSGIDPASLSQLNWTGSEFAVIWNERRPGCETPPPPPLICVGYLSGPAKFARISAGGQILGQITLSPDSYDHPAMAWNGWEFGVSWDDGDLWFGRLDPQGNPAGISQRITKPPAYSWKSSLAWTGSEYGLTWIESGPNDDYDVFFTRIRFDEDGDGLTDSLEPDLGTDPNDWDSDDDEMPDGFEALQGAACGIDPLLPDADLDNDGDGLTNLQEYDLKTNPCSPDTDGDGLSDQYEGDTSHTDPLVADTDGDGLTDGDEVNTSHTDPLNWDSDGDRLPDGFEAVNGGHSGGGLDPLNALDAAADFDADGNSNANEYWNGSDPWVKDPVPGGYADPACYYWGDGDGDGTPAPSDLVMLKLEIAGAAQAYRFILPHGIDTLDLDRDGYAAPADLGLLKQMIAGAERPGGYPSQALSLEVVGAPSGTVAAGTTTHVTLSVHSVSGTVPYAPGFGVVFEVVSGNAVLLGGDGTADGEAAGNRYDFSMEAASGAKANMVVLVTGPGPVTIGAKIPGCGVYPNGRWNDEVVLNPPVAINSP